MLNSERRKIPGPRHTPAEEVSDCVMKSERGALVIGAPTHPRLITVLTPTPARRLTKFNI